MATDDEVARLVETFHGLGSDLRSRAKLADALEALTRRSVEVVPGAEHSAVSRDRGGRFETIAATSDIPLQVDSIQYSVGSGPCVDAVLDDRIYRTGDLGADTRWPEFGRRAVAETPVRSMLSVRLFLEGDEHVAGLNLYAGARDAFPVAAEYYAILLATHGATAIVSAQRNHKIVNLERALQSNRTIGMAIGILMGLHKITQEQAFDVLRVASQHGNRKLADVAADVVETGTVGIPDGP